MARYVREQAEYAGHSSLARAGKSTVWRILNAHEIKPHRLRYYLERRDNEFESKMHEILIIYREIAMDIEADAPETPRPVYTINVDEKPSVQALATSAPDLPPIPGRHATIGRGHDYIRLGTVSILAGIDLHDGHVIAQVHDRHRSLEFIELLKEIDDYYPPDSAIRVILDNHSSHISKVARIFLRHIRVSSKDELIERITKGAAEMNEHPVIFRWRNLDQLSVNS